MPTQPSAAELFGDDDSSDSDESKKINKEEAKEADKSKPPPEKPHALDDDSDDSEQDFDDGGAVVGLASTTMTGKGTSRVSERIREKTDGSDEDSSDDIIPVHKEGDKRTLVIQDHSIGSDLQPSQLRITKLPNLIGIQTEAFDESTYSAKQEDEDFGQAAHSLMRWTKGENGKLESNTRFVEWEDGSMTLHVGNEVFNIDSQDHSNKDTKFPGMNGYLYLSSQGASYKPGEDSEETKNETAGTVLECMGSIHSRLMIKPSSLQSEAHKSLTLGIRQKTVKHARIAEIVTQHDPEKLKSETAKLKSDIEKSRNRYSSGGRRSRVMKRSREYLEGDEDDEGYNTYNLKEVKRRTMGGDFDDDEDSEDDYASFRQTGKAKAAADSDSDEMVLDTQEDEEKVVSKRKQQQKTTILDDDDDSE